MKKKVEVFILIIIMLLLTGCWNRIELNDVAVVTAIALDKMDDNEVLMTMQIAIPKLLSSKGSSGMGEPKNPMLIISEKGKSIMEINKKIQKKLSREIALSHCRLIIIGDKLAQEGILPTLDYFWGNVEFRLGSFVLFTKGEGADILKVMPKLEEFNSEKIRRLEILRIGVQTTLLDLVNVLMSEGVQPLVAQISTEPIEVKNNEDFKGKESNPTNITLGIGGTAVLNKDKLVGWMNIEETSETLMLLNEMRTEMIAMDFPDEKDGFKVGMMITAEKTKIKPIFIGDEVKIEIETYVKSSIYENTSKLELSHPKVLEFIQKGVEENIKQRVQAVVNKAQKQWKSDIFGFGEAIYRKDPKKWKEQYKKEWDEKFPEIQVNIIPHVKISSIGNTYTPLKKPGEELIKIE